jgi:hypothetical protein
MATIGTVVSDRITPPVPLHHPEEEKPSATLATTGTGVPDRTTSSTKQQFFEKDPVELATIGRGRYDYTTHPYRVY